MKRSFEPLFPGIEQHLCKVGVQSGGYVLIRHYIHFFSLSQPLDEPKGEVRFPASRPRYIYDASPRYTITKFLAQKLGEPIIVHRRCLIFLPVHSVLSVEDVIRGNVNQKRAHVSGSFQDKLSPSNVNPMGEVLISFAFIDVCKGSSVEYDIGLCIINRF